MEYTKAKIAATMELLTTIGAFNDKNEHVRDIVERELKQLAKTAISESRQLIDSVLFDFDHNI